jgi:erythromycin esterase
LADSDYGTKRDSYMADNVEWILEYEESFYGNNRIFIAGHNGHIGKTTATVGTEKIMGELLAEKYGDEYFAIGTEFYESTFLASDYNTGERKEYRVKNSGNSRLAVLLHEIANDSLYLKMEVENTDSDLARYLNEKQPMSSIGDMFSNTFSKTEKAYTQKIAPYKAYNGIIFIDTLTPSTMLDSK